MLERLRHFAHIRHRKSGKEFSTLQKLNLFYQAQRRPLLGSKAQFLALASANPTIKLQLHDAIRAIGACEDALYNEYRRDHDALVKHLPQEAEHEQV
jgi:hypothetical protein